MRHPVAIFTVMTCLAVVPASATERKPTPNWDDCYRVGIDRGVHVELYEMPGWMDECLVGKIPLDSVAPGDSKASHTTRRRARSGA